MFRLNKSDIKYAIKGLLISAVLLRSLAFPLIHMLMIYLIPNLAFTIMDTILMLSMAVFVAGVYIGLSNAQNKYLISSVAGILYFPTAASIALFLYNKHLDVNYTILFGMLIDGVVSLLGTIIAQSIVKWRRKA